MNLARSVADVLAEHVTLRGRVHRPDVLQRLRPAAAVRRRAGRLSSTSSSGCRLPRPRRWLGSPTGSSSRSTRSPRQHQIPWVDFVKGQRKDDVMHDQLGRLRGVRPDRGGGVHRPGAGEDEPCSGPRSAATPRARSYPWIVQIDRDGEPLLLLLPRCRLRPVLPQVLLLLPLHRETVPQRSPLGPTPSRARPGSGSPRWTTRSPRSTTSSRAAGDLRRVRPGADLRLAGQVADPICRTRSPPPTGPPATATRSRSCRPSSP